MQQKPFVAALPYYTDSRVYFERLRTLNGCAWLDSGLTGNRVDILCAEPREEYRNLDEASLSRIVAAQKEDVALHHLADWPFTGGLIGYKSYEDQHPEYGLSRPQDTDTHNIWHLYDWAVMQDHRAKKAIAVFLPSCSESDRQLRLNLLKSTPPTEANKKQFEVLPFKADISRQEYADAFQKIKAYILAGDAYQINYTQRFSSTYKGDMANAYIYLRQQLSGSYSAYLNFGDRQILSLSPEQFIKIRQNEAQTKPIKGTIKRGSNAAEDKALARSLHKSEKNRAENLMIVDLLRNDFSKNCRRNSVRVPKLFALKSYQNVHHLVSKVTGVLKQGVSPLTFLKDCFPGGSITGAPKKRAMEIIDELEPYPRDIYCGSIAYISTNGNLDSSIAIRTLYASSGKIFCWGGGGIVADSVEEDEYQESIQKVQILMSALSEYKQEKTEEV